MKIATYDQNALIKGEPSPKAQSLIKSYKKMSTPGKAKGKTSTTARPRVGAAVRAASSATRIKTGKNVVQKVKAVKKAL